MARSAESEQHLPTQRRANARLAGAGGVAMSGFGGKVAGAQPGRFVRDHMTVATALCAFAPMLLISALGWLYADRLRPIVPIELTNLDAVKTLLKGMIHASVRPDSWGPMLRALAVLRGPDHDLLYQTLFFEGHVRFQYPPTSLLSLDLLSALGLASVRVLNAINTVAYLLNAVATGVLLWLLFRGKGRAAERNGFRLSAGGMAAIGVVAAFTFYPDVRAHILGQIQVWIDLLFTCAVIAWWLDRRLLAGVLIGLACTIKPQFALLLLWALLWREWRFCRGMLAAFVPVALVSLLRYGLPAHLGYLNVLAFLSRHGESFFANNSVNGILNGYFSETSNMIWDPSGFPEYHPLVYAGTAAASILALAVIVFVPLLSRKIRPGAIDFGVAAICTVVGSPVAWEHHYGILLPIFAIALRYGLELPAGFQRGLLLVLLGVSWALVANFIPFADLLAGTNWQLLQAHLFFGALLLLVLLLGRMPAGLAALADKSGSPGQRD
ncbi:MAG TPA: glycosyltransferase family 87 protein [Rhodopila sp.]|nr:glycosyltransferase family 87 protein [Rhodopila sp.]